MSSNKVLIRGAKVFAAIAAGKLAGRCQDPGEPTVGVRRYTYSDDTKMAV
jgi:hypothetical protein